MRVRRQEGGWIDRATRMVMVAFNVHNANYDVTVAFKYVRAASASPCCCSSRGGTLRYWSSRRGAPF